MSDYYKLADKVVERAKKLYDESDKDMSLNIYTRQRLAGKCVDEAVRELIVSKEDKWTLIQESCTDTDELCYEGNPRFRFDTPYSEFYTFCLHQLIERLI